MARSLLLVALPLSHALLAPPTSYARIPALRAIVNYQVEEGGEARATPLSDDFDGAVQDAANGLLGAIQDGSLKLRLDFDTSMGDDAVTPELGLVSHCMHRARVTCQEPRMGNPRLTASNANI